MFVNTCRNNTDCFVCHEKVLPETTIIELTHQPDDTTPHPQKAIRHHCVHQECLHTMYPKGLLGSFQRKEPLIIKLVVNEEDPIRVGGIRAGKAAAAVYTSIMKKRALNATLGALTAITATFLWWMSSMQLNSNDEIPPYILPGLAAFGAGIVAVKGVDLITKKSASVFAAMQRKREVAKEIAQLEHSIQQKPVTIEEEIGGIIFGGLTGAVGIVPATVVGAYAFANEGLLAGIKSGISFPRTAARFGYGVGLSAMRVAKAITNPIACFRNYQAAKLRKVENTQRMNAIAEQVVNMHTEKTKKI